MRSPTFSAYSNRHATPRNILILVNILFILFLYFSVFSVENKVKSLESVVGEQNEKVLESFSDLRSTLRNHRNQIEEQLKNVDSATSQLETKRSMDLLKKKLERIENQLKQKEQEEILKSNQNSNNQQMDEEQFKQMKEFAKRLELLELHSGANSSLGIASERISMLTNQIEAAKNQLAAMRDEILDANEQKSTATRWKEFSDAQAITVFQNRIYDLDKPSYKDKLDILDDLHQHLDGIVKECECGRDGMSNNNIQRQVYFKVSSDIKPDVVCETGFNAGHGAAAFLMGARKRARYIGFDLFSRTYVQRAVDTVAGVFNAASVDVVEGSSGIEARRFFENFDNKNILIAKKSKKTDVKRLRCDIVHIDGGRFQGIPEKDLRNFHYLSRENATVIMDDVLCGEDNKHVCAEPGRAWHRLKLEGKIIEDECYEKPEEQVHFCVGRFIAVPQ